MLHGAGELKHAPDLKKTKLCFEFLEGCCLRSAACPFAHSCEDLCVTASVCKAQPCFLFERGSCKKGLRRRHAHGVGELRCPLTFSIRSPNAEPRVHRSPVLAGILPEDRIGVAGQDLPADHAPSESHSVSEAFPQARSQSTPSARVCDDMLAWAHSAAKDVVFLGD